MNNQEHLRNIREYEANLVEKLLPEKANILEIGAGSGWQSKRFEEIGHTVTAIDVEKSEYLSQAVLPIKLYDGVKIPFPNNSFDIVFSSNALEHIPNVAEYQDEIRRVLKPNGYAVHVLPTGVWRFWTNVTHYLWLLQVPFSSHLRKQFLSSINPPPTTKLALKTKVKKALLLLLPSRHGEDGNSLTEIYYFSRFRWIKLFREKGFALKACYPNQLFYTGYSVFDESLSISTRHQLSRILGSACLIYVLQNTKE